MTYTANTDYIQATIEILGALICVVASAMLAIATGKKRKSEIALMHLLFAAAAALVVDAGWYIVDGNLGSAAFFLNRFFNFFLFLLNPIQLFFAGSYLCLTIEEKNGSVHRGFFYFPIVTLIIGAIMPIVNIFLPFIYSFDENNVYYRMDGWYAYTAVNVLTIVLFVIAVVRHKKSVSVKRRISLYIFLASPFLGTLIQIFNLGISFIQIGTAIGILIVLITYVYEWVLYEKDKRGMSNEKKKFWLIECVFLIMILCVSASIVSSVVAVESVTRKNSIQHSVTTSQMVNETIDGALAEPINVARTLARSALLSEAVSMDINQLKNSMVEKRLLEELKDIKEEYDYQMVFVASEKTQAYYTYEGFSRYMDTSVGGRDAWYASFKGKNRRYEMNVDADKDNNLSLAVFANVRIVDENKSLHRRLWCGNIHGKTDEYSG